MSFNSFYDLYDVRDYFGEGPPLIVETLLSTSEGTGSTLILLKQYEGANPPRYNDGELVPLYRRFVLKTPLGSGRDMNPFGSRNNELKWLRVLAFQLTPTSQLFPLH